MIVLSGLFLLFLLSLGFVGARLIANEQRQITRATSRRLDQIVPHFRPVDIAELKEMLNIAEEGYLRLNLTPQQFRRTQNDRILLVLEYLGRMSHNVALLYKWGGHYLLRRSGALDRETRQASRLLIDLCKAFRGVSWLARLRLRLWLLKIRVLPFASEPCLADVRAVRRVDLVYTYEQIKAVVFVLCQSSGAPTQEQLLTGL